MGNKGLKVAFLTPWPPQKTGIADYAFDLVSGLLATGYDVHVYTDCPQISNIDFEGRVHHVDSFESERTAFDKVVYQMGNNSDFHLYMISLIKKYGGIVHLHDMVLHHIMAWCLFNNKDRFLYYRLLSLWYGFAVSQNIKKYNETVGCFWDSSSVSDYPFFEEILQNASVVITHSQFARNKIRKAFPRKPGFVIPQLYSGLPVIKQTSNDAFIIGVFGIVVSYKHIDKIIRTIAECRTRGLNVRLEVVGKVYDECTDLYELKSSFGLDDSAVRFHGFQDQKSFHDILSLSDVCICLRYPTMGETSAVAMKALQMGIPTIVNDVGWYSELPSCVIKIPIDETFQKKLDESIIRLSSDSDYYKKIKASTVSFAESNFSFENVIKDYMRILSNE
jgi:glycosyltransferase involved in cell wall biosynthesis